MALTCKKSGREIMVGDLVKSLRTGDTAPYGRVTSFERCSELELRGSWSNSQTLLPRGVEDWCEGWTGEGFEIIDEAPIVYSFVNGVAEWRDSKGRLVPASCVPLTPINPQADMNAFPTGTAHVLQKQIEMEMGIHAKIDRHGDAQLVRFQESLREVRDALASQAEIHTATIASRVKTEVDDTFQRMSIEIDNEECGRIAEAVVARLGDNSRECPFLDRVSAAVLSAIREQMVQTMFTLPAAADSVPDNPEGIQVGDKVWQKHCPNFGPWVVYGFTRENDVNCVVIRALGDCGVELGRPHDGGTWTPPTKDNRPLAVFTKIKPDPLPEPPIELPPTELSFLDKHRSTIVCFTSGFAAVCAFMAAYTALTTL